MTSRAVDLFGSESPTLHCGRSVFPNPKEGDVVVQPYKSLLILYSVDPGFASKGLAGMGAGKIL